MTLIKELDHQILLSVVENILKDPLEPERARRGRKKKGSRLKKGRRGELNRVTETAGKKIVTEKG